MKSLHVKFVLFQLLCLTFSTTAQVVRIKVMENGGADGVPDVAISLQGGEQVWRTDRSGNSLFNLSRGSHRLQLTKTGFEPHIAMLVLRSDTSINIFMRRKEVILDSVVVSTGYQRINRERATGAFTLIGNQLYNEQIGTNALERLRYITNGVAPVADRITNLGENPMLIRGMSSLTLSVQRPLVVVDGFEYQGDLNNINPNDIEDVTFLKDAAAGSIWGAKAANGVIVMRTRKGSLGQKLNVAMSANLGISGPPDLFYDRKISAPDLIDVEKLLFANKYRFTDTARTNRPPFSEAYELMFSHKNGKITDSQLTSSLDVLSRRDVRNDFKRYLYGNSVNQQYAVNLSGGSGQHSWYFSAGRDDNRSELAAGYTRNTLRLSNQLRLSNSLNANLDVAYTRSASTSGGPEYGSVRPSNGQLPVYAALADDIGNALPLYAFYRKGYIDEIGGGKLLDWRYYPLEDYKYSRNKTALYDINATFSLDYRLLEWLKLSASYRLQQQRSSQRIDNTLDSYFTRNLINMYTQVAGNGSVSYKVPMGNILNGEVSDILANNVRGQINIDQRFGSFGLVGVAGTEWSEKVTTGSSDRVYGYDPELLTSVPVDLVNQYPLYMTGSMGNIPSVASITGLNNRFASMYGNFALSYLDRYTLTGSARRDASNIFGQSTNDRWKPLWSLGLGWIVTGENWFKRDWAQQLKLRGSYGKQGNIDPRKVAVTTISYGSNNPFTLSPFSLVNNYPNPDLRWEQVAMLNLGVDFSLFGGRLSGSVEHYQKNMSDLYANVQIDRTTGIASGSVVRNIGKAKGQGWDMEFKLRQNVGGFGLNQQLIVNTYRDKVVRFDSEFNTAGQLMTGSSGIVQGYSTFSLFAYRWAGLDPVNGDPMGYYNGNVTKDYSQLVNQTRIEDALPMGSQLPKVFGSLGLGMNWKNLSLSMRIGYKLDYFFKRSSIDYGALVGQLNGHADYALRWRQPGDEGYTSVPSFTFPINSLRDSFYSNAAVLFERADHIRLQYVQIGYQISKKDWNGLPLKGISLKASANDLGILWRANKYGLDPDVGTFPRPARINLGLTTEF